SIGEIVQALVGDVYPGATVVFDDDSDQASIGRPLLFEEKRYEALKDIADSLGKVMYWDGEGVLRVEDAPDPDDIVWHLRAGRGGVLADSRRGVSREGMYNGIVARGEGGDQSDPVTGIAVDTCVHSPTRWSGRFATVPRFSSSPLVTTAEQAQQAAVSLLRRYIGMPYSVSFGVVPNPALRPRQAVRITQRDGNRETHIVQTCVVPLTEDAAMTGTTREQTLVQIGQP